MLSVYREKKNDMFWEGMTGVFAAELCYLAHLKEYEVGSIAT